MPEDLESSIAQALTDQGGPPELAPQLIALAVQHQLTSCLKQWILYHRGEEWSGLQFDQWCVKLKELAAAVNVPIERISDAMTQERP